MIASQAAGSLGIIDANADAAIVDLRGQFSGIPTEDRVSALHCRCLTPEEQHNSIDTREFFRSKLGNSQASPVEVLCEAPFEGRQLLSPYLEPRDSIDFYRTYVLEKEAKNFAQPDPRIQSICEMKGLFTIRGLPRKMLMPWGDRDSGDLRKNYPGPACGTERKFGEAEFSRLIEDPRNRDLPTLLSSIPADALPTYTLVWHSKSPSGATGTATAASKRLPRVIRSTMDGRFTIAYTCDPSFPEQYGKIEMMIQEAETSKMRLREFDLKKRGTDSFELKDTSSCERCHGSDPHALFGQYFNWPGVFGHNDDHVSFAERQELLELKKTQAQNPCYGALPGFIDRNAPETYPYNDPRLNVNDLRFRPNSRMVTQYSALLAERNARRFEEMLKEKPAKYLFLSRALNCDLNDEQLNRMRFYTTPGGTAPSELQNLQGLDQLSDWSLERTPLKSDRTYSTGEASIETLTAGILLRKWAAADRSLQPFTPLLTYYDVETADDGQVRYGCLDSVAPSVGGYARGVDESSQLKRSLCAQLSRLAGSTSSNEATPGVAPTRTARTNASQLSKLQASIARKKVLVDEKCGSCHFSEFQPDAFRQKDLTLKSAGKDLISMMDERIRSKDLSKRMPQGKSAPLTREERKDVLDYFRFLRLSEQPKFH